MRAHLKDSSEPLVEGSQLTVLCGKEIRHSEFVFKYDGDVYFFRDFLNAMTQCRRCVIKAEEKIVDGGEQGRSYWYGITEAEPGERGERRVSQ